MALRERPRSVPEENRTRRGDPHRGTTTAEEEEIQDIKRLIDAIQSEHPLDETDGAMPSQSQYTDPFLDPAPPILGVRSSASDVLNLEPYLHDESLINVQIKSTNGRSSAFFLPVALLVERELDMRQAAQQFGISKDRWSDSLLYREWRLQMDDQSSIPNQRDVTRQTNGDLLITLDPERECAQSNHSQSLVWEQWLTTCIRAYYNTGSIRIPDESIGSDVLLALEYFGVVYTPEQLIFDSFGAYLRVKLWSEYYTHRSQLAEWVVEWLMCTQAKPSHVFVTSLSPSEHVRVSNREAQILDGGLMLDPVKYDNTLSCAVVHDFFHGGGLDGLMRKDFAAFVEGSLPGTQVSFSVMAVTLEGGEQTDRAVLQVSYKTVLPSTHRGGGAAGYRSATENKPPVQPRPAVPGIPKAKSTLTVDQQAKEVNLRQAPSADHIYEELAKPKRRQDLVRLPPSINHVYEDLNHAPLAPSRAPSKDTGRGRQQPEAQNLETIGDKVFATDPRAPLRTVEWDHVTVASGLTQEDPMFAHAAALKLQREREEAQRRYRQEQQHVPNQSHLQIPTQHSRKMPQKEQDFQKPVEPTGERLVESMSLIHKQQQLHQTIVPNRKYSTYASTLGTSDQTGTTYVTNPIVGQCGAGFHKALCVLLGKDSGTVKTEVESDENSNEAPHTSSAMSTVEKFLPDVDIRSHPDMQDSRFGGSSYPDKSDSLESMTAAWLRNAFSFSNYIYDEPVADRSDEYLQLARRAHEGNRRPRMPDPQPLQRKPPQEQNRSVPTTPRRSNSSNKDTPPIHLMDRVEQRAREIEHRARIQRIVDQEKATRSERRQDLEYGDNAKDNPGPTNDVAVARELPAKIPERLPNRGERFPNEAKSEKTEHSDETDKVTNGSTKKKSDGTLLLSGKKKNEKPRKGLKGFFKRKSKAQTLFEA